jgi:hypothetical protein
VIELLVRIWGLLTPIHNQILSLIFTLIAAVIYWVFRSRVKLIWGRTNKNLHQIKLTEGNLEIFCEKNFLQNTGKKPATDVEFVFSWKPDNVTVWQPRDHKQIELPSGELAVKIPFIAPKELVIIDSVYINKKGAFIASVKCAEIVGRSVDFITNRNFGTKFNITALVLIFMGAAFLLQILIGFILDNAS